MQDTLVKGSPQRLFTPLGHLREPSCLTPAPACAPLARGLTTRKNQIKEPPSNQRASPFLILGPETSNCRSMVLGSPNQKLACTRQGQARPRTWRFHILYCQGPAAIWLVFHGQSDSRQLILGLPGHWGHRRHLRQSSPAAQT